MYFNTFIFFPSSKSQILRLYFLYLDGFDTGASEISAWQLGSGPFIWYENNHITELRHMYLHFYMSREDL